MKKKTPGRPKRAHFDYPNENEQDILNFVGDPSRVASHAFLPFLLYNIKTRRFRKKEGAKKAIPDWKVRPIRVASHRDTYIFTNYNQILAEAYEDHIKGTAIDPCAIAYRKGKGSNIDFAKEVFDFVQVKSPCVVIAADLKDFYETIDHAHLKELWCKLIGVTRLPNDHFNVFKAITKFAVIPVDRLKSEIGLKKHDKLPRPIFRTMTEFRDVAKRKNSSGKNLIERNNDTFGIPQGSPMSATLSNIAMISFDERLAHFVDGCGGLYRRYSDDILLVVPQAQFKVAADEIAGGLVSMPGPIVENDEKRIVSVFNARGQLERGDIQINGEKVRSRELQYLGFTYDGDKIRIRSQTIARYWRRVTWGVRAAKRRAAGNPVENRLYKRKLYRRFSHLGRSNLHSYKRNSIAKMGDTGIKEQFSRNWVKLEKEMDGPIKSRGRPSRSSSK
jgi:hypothetical protein